MKNDNRIIIAEPSSMLRAGLASFFEDVRHITIVAQLDNLSNLNEKLISHNPDILIINPLMFGCSNNNFLRQIIQNNPEMACVALVYSYLDQDMLKYFKEIIEINDKKQKVISKIINLLNDNKDSSLQNENVGLSDRELDVLVDVAKGMTNKDISDHLNISVHTVMTHRKNIIKKTGIKSVSGLTVYALLNNLIDESEIYK